MKNTNFTFIPNRNITEIQPSLIRAIQEIKHDGKHERINLGLGELQFSIPEKAREANANALNDGRNLYSSNAGLSELRIAVVKDFFKKNNVDYDKENVIITVGSTGALFIAFETFLSAGDEILIPSLHYPLYSIVPKKLGAVIIEYNLQEDFSPDTEDILSKITSKTKLVVLNTPSNPTGCVTSDKILSELAKKTEKYSSLFFISDEVYSTCLYNDTKHVSIASFTDRVIVVDGLSKRASMTGKRLGWLIGPSVVINQAVKVQQYAYTCAPVDSQYAALSVLSGECDKDLEYYQTELLRKRQVMLEQLSQLDNITYSQPNGAFYCWIDTSFYGTSMDVAERFIKEVNVVTTPGLAFGKAGNNYIRLSFAGSDSSIITGISKIKGVLNTWQ